MKTLHRRCGGIDVHSANVVACIRVMTKGKVRHEVRRFSASTRDLLALRDWFEAEKITHVAMEATGVYWKPVWHILEEKFTLILANAAHVRNLPGRKSDVNDATWIADLLAHGLIRPSFVPPAPVQELRDLTRTRTQLMREAARHIQRIQKALRMATYCPRTTRRSSYHLPVPSALWRSGADQTAARALGHRIRRRTPT
jgi:transposase